MKMKNWPVGPAEREPHRNLTSVKCLGKDEPGRGSIITMQPSMILTGMGVARPMIQSARRREIVRPSKR